MAVDNYDKTQAFAAGEDLSAKQNYFVKISAANTVSLAGAGEDAIGVNTENAASGETTGVMCEGGGKIKVVAGAIVAFGAKITSDANGKAVTAALGDYVYGTSLEAAAADKDLISMIWAPEGVNTHA